jgi:hypothetical protein
MPLLAEGEQKIPILGDEVWCPGALVTRGGDCVDVGSFEKNRQQPGQGVGTNDHVPVHERDYLSARKLNAAIARVCGSSRMPGQLHNRVSVSCGNRGGAINTGIIYDDDLVGLAR